jgi:hypothetical protein
MRPIRWFVAVTAVALATSPLVLGQSKPKPNFSGEWVMVPEKSTFGQGKTPDVLTMNITHDDPALKVVQTRWPDKTVGQPTEITNTCKIDGKAATTKAQQPIGRANGNAVTAEKSVTTVAQWDGVAIVVRITQSLSTSDGSSIMAVGAAQQSATNQLDSTTVSRFELSDDGKTLTVTRKLTNPGQDVTNKIVLTKK